jgi:YD repeat-containing protein
MKFGYDAVTDTLRIVLSSTPIAESDEDKPGVILDYDAEGNIVGIEVLQASKRTDNPNQVERLSA